jgi:hypothetical protein
VIVYHGTTSEHAARILEHGLDARTCVTSDESLAWYYAECAVDETVDRDSDIDEVVLRLHVTDTELACDHAALQEPVGWAGRTGSQIEQQITAELADIDHRTFSAHTSLTYAASARVNCLIAPDRIRRI